MTPSLELQQHLDALQSTIGEGNAKRGFHDEGDYYREQFKRAAEVDLPDAPAALRNYYMTKLALIHSEVTEAVEELRKGYPVTGNYWTHANHPGQMFNSQDIRDSGEPHDSFKPEGVPSEVADVVIRCFDFADEAGFSLGEIILEKLAFNATRGRMHGGKQV